MAMLAEKKRREKWCLNPRGKAWSEDQNKFGQRLLEKMGWKAGQGLGANSQGQTDIVKTRVKNDNKGLGFKENGEEWLKTTSDFDNLLEELASSREDSGEGSQTETPVSLEDRSKKSRARVHYHKFTRGKDLSRYSVKDLASIIGPDVIKLKNDEESKSDYTQNQVNKGSLKEYFDSKKSKTVDDKSSSNTINGDVKNELKDDLLNSHCSEENSENYKNSDKIVPVSLKKKKKKKINVEENTAPMIEESENCKDYTVLASEVEESDKSKRKRKGDCGFESNLQDHEESDPNGLNSSLPGSLKKFKKKKSCMEATEQENLGLGKSIAEEKTPKNKKRKAKGEETEQPEGDVFSINNNTIIADSEDNGELMPKKKRKKFRNENKEYGEDIKTEYYETYSINNSVASEEIVTNVEITTKNKKKKEKYEQCWSDSVKAQTENALITASNPVASEEGVAKDKLATKKKKKLKDKNEEHLTVDIQSDGNVMNVKINPVHSKDSRNPGPEETNDHAKNKGKKKSKDETRGHEEESSEKEQLEVKNKHKLDNNSSETTVSHEQVVSHKKPEGFLEVLGRKTRLKAIKNVRKTAISDSYSTEEFMSFFKSDNFKEEAAEEDSSIPQNTTDDKREYVNIYIKPNPSDLKINMSALKYEYKLVKEKLIKYSIVKKPRTEVVDSKNLGPSALSKLREIHRVRFYKDLLSDQDKFEIDSAVKKFMEEKSDRTCRIEPNTENCSMPKHVVAYEYRMVTSKLKQLGISVPELKVVINDSSALLETTKRKLRQIAKIRKLKTLLPTDELKEIEALVSKFYDDLKPKIEIMNVLQELEDNILNIAQHLDGKHESNLNEDGTTKFKSLLSEKADEISTLFQKLEKLLYCKKRIKDESSTSENTKEDADIDDPDKIEKRRKWLNKVEHKLNILRRHMKMINEGKKPSFKNEIIKELKQSKSSWKKNHHYQNSGYSKGRIAHNVVMRRGGGFGRNHSFVKKAVPIGGSGSLESDKTGTEPRDATEGHGQVNSLGNEGRFRGRGRGPGVGFSGPGRGFSHRGGFSGPGRGFSHRGGYSGQGRGFGPGEGFSGPGRDFGHRGEFSSPGRGFGYGGGFSGPGRGFGDARGFRGRGRGDFRGRGRGGPRGRIHKNNLDARKYAEECKEQNKVPDICFNGVNIRGISGYPAVDKNSSLRSEDSKLQEKKESYNAVSTTKKVSADFLEVVVRKEKQPGDGDQVTSNS